MILLSDLKREFEAMSDRELRDVCAVLMPIIGRRFRPHPDPRISEYQKRNGPDMVFEVTLPKLKTVTVTPIEHRLSRPGTKGAS